MISQFRCSTFTWKMSLGFQSFCLYKNHILTCTLTVSTGITVHYCLYTSVCVCLILCMPDLVVYTVQQVLYMYPLNIICCCHSLVQSEYFQLFPLKQQIGYKSEVQYYNYCPLSYNNNSNNNNDDLTGPKILIKKQSFPFYVPPPLPPQVRFDKVLAHPGVCLGMEKSLSLSHMVFYSC